MDNRTFAALFRLIKKIENMHAPTITIGNVESGAEPSVTNSGDNKNAVFDFVIPSVIITDDNNGNVAIN